MQWKLDIQLDADLTFPDIVAVQIYQIFAAAPGFAVQSMDPDPFSVSGKASHQYTLILATDQPDEPGLAVEALFADVKGLAGWEISLSPGTEEDKSTLAEKKAEGKSTAEKKNGKRNGKQIGHIRIGLEKVEQLVDLVGELIISKSQVDTISHQLRQKSQSAAAAIDFDLASNQLDLVIRQLRDLSLSVRMVPLDLTLARLPAMVRELARKQKKEVRLLLSGGETELDKVILEALTDPLTHLLRNAIDHGLEAPQVRKASGKSEEGHILIEAFYEDDNLKVIIEDDGRGLDLEAIKVQGIERGLLSQDRGVVSEQEILDLIFQPGFSTARSITDISGRGVGMDVVKSNIEKIGGRVQIESQLGLGTRITLGIPLTLSIVDALLVKDQEQVFALPLLSIGKVSRIKAAEIQTVGQSLLVNLGSYSVPAFSISELFGNNGQSLPPEVFVIETALQDGRSGIIVEQVLGQQEIVIKSLGGYLGQVTGISGGTILGDGRVALIIDVKGCLQQMHRLHQNTLAEAVRTIPMIPLLNF